MDAQTLPLRDIHLPEPVGWWPPAPGWWGLLLLAALVVVTLAWLRRRRARKALKSLVLRELSALRDDPRLGRGEKIRALSVILRRVAVSVYPRSEVAGLTGPAWLEFLDGAMPGQPFSRGVGRELLEAPYRRHVEAPLDALFTLCEAWIKALPERAP